MFEPQDGASAESSQRTVSLHMAPQLFSRRLGADLYSPAQALEQLVANALDAGCSSVSVAIHENQMGVPDVVTISDDGRGMSPADVDSAFATVGEHSRRPRATRDVIGSKGIGRFAAFALAYSVRWETVGDQDGKRVRQSWTLAGDSTDFLVDSLLADGTETGTTVTLYLKDRDGVQRLFSGVRSVHRALFNSFAGYLLRYRTEVAVEVNGEPLDLSEFVEAEQIEEIPEGDGPAAQ